MFIVSYAKFIDDKEMGTIMSGIFLGGLCEEKSHADELAKRCVMETQGGIIVPRVFEVRSKNFSKIITEIEEHFESLANEMYDNEQTYNKHNRNNL